MNGRIKTFRTQLHLPVDYVAKYLGICKSDYIQLENGGRKGSERELKLLGVLFGVSPDGLQDSNEAYERASKMIPGFEELCEKDKAGVVNLLRFRDQLLKQRVN